MVSLRQSKPRHVQAHVQARQRSPKTLQGLQVKNISSRAQQECSRTEHISLKCCGLEAKGFAIFRECSGNAVYTKYHQVMMPTASGRTPLHWGAHHGHTNIVKELLAVGAAKDVQDNEGQLLRAEVTFDFDSLAQKAQ